MATNPIEHDDNFSTEGISLMKTQEFDGFQVQVGDPVQVGRAPGHHWFPMLHPVAGSDILCQVVTAPDMAQGQWPGRLYLSRDGGQSWGKVCEIDCCGPSSVSLGEGRILLMPYEQWPLSPGDKHNTTADGTVIALLADGTVTTERTQVRFLGFPRELDDYHDDELCLLTNGNILRLDDGRLFTTLYGRFRPNTERHQYECVAVVSDDRGFTWHYLADVASWRNTPGAPEGPDESNTARLPDGRLMCVFRVGSGRGHHYYTACSADQGRTWTEPRRMDDQWSVEPQLVCLDNGALLLSGGRPGLMLWVCTDGKGERWQTLNLAEHHNASFPDPALHFPESCVAASDGVKPACTTSYTGMKAVGPDEALICYDRLGNGWDGAPGPWGAYDIVFTVRVRVSLLTAKAQRTQRTSAPVTHRN